jgi:DHA1 family tetracycline resistance protein-like MFS transporter
MNFKSPIFFIFITILIDCIGIGIIFPVAASIITDVSGLPVNEATTYSGYMMACYALMQFICSPTLGGLSDRYGRRPILLFSLLGLGIDYLFLAVANSLPLLFAGRVIAGICGASFTTGFAYIADVSPPEKRAQNFGLVGAAFGLGFIIGPLIGGIASQWGVRVPFMVAAFLSLLNFIYGYFILPESLKPENRRAFSFKRANPLGAFKQIQKNKRIRTLVFSMFLLYLTGQVMPSIWTFYTKYVYHWSDTQIGYSLAFVGIMIVIVQGLLIKRIQRFLGSINTIYFGLVCYFVGLVLFSFATQPWMLYAFTIVYCLGGVTPPSLQGILSNRVSANEQGELQGMMTALTSLSTILSPIIMTHLFYTFTKNDAPIHFAGAPLCCCCIICNCCCFCYL